jgi:hypothetical protein
VVSFFGFFSFQWSIFHLFQTKKEEHPKWYWKTMCKSPSKTDQSVCVDIQIPQLDWGIWMLTQINWCLFTTLWQCHLEPETTTGLSSFCLGYFFWLTNFKHFVKDANIFHPKSG